MFTTLYNYNLCSSPFSISNWISIDRNASYTQ